MENSKTVDALNDLLQITNDRIAGFKKVDEQVMDSYSGLAHDFDNMSGEAAQMRSELSSLVTERGGNPDNDTTVAGGLHRTWIDVKNSLSSDKEEAVLENITFGEKAAIEAYEKALESGDLCTDSSKVVQTQLQKLRASYQKFSSMEERKN